MNEIQFVRFQCDAGHISAFRFASEDVSLEYCPVCGDTDVTQLESQYVEADIEGDTSTLEVCLPDGADEQSAKADASREVDL